MNLDKAGKGYKTIAEQLGEKVTAATVPISKHPNDSEDWVEVYSAILSIFNSTCCVWRRNAAYESKSTIEMID